MTTAQHLARQQARESTNTTGTELSQLYVSLALLGIAALAAAAASSLISGLGGDVLGGSVGQGAGMLSWAPWLWIAGITSGAYCLAALVYGLVSFQQGTVPHVGALARVVAVAATVHLAGLLQGLWQIPDTARTFDVTLASLLVLEFSVLAVLGWRHNVTLRRDPSGLRPVKRSATVVVGALFVSSVLVAAITTVGMAASTAGELAVPHSGHSDSGAEKGPAIPKNLQQLKNQGHHH